MSAEQSDENLLGKRTKKDFGSKCWLKPTYSYNSRKNFKTENWYSRNDFIKANASNSEGLKFIQQLSKYNKKKILYASHAFGDAPHAHGSFIFNDYFEQFKETLLHAQKDDRNIWIFRAHQNSRLLNEKKIFKKYVNYKY